MLDPNLPWLAMGYRQFKKEEYFKTKHDLDYSSLSQYEPAEPKESQRRRVKSATISRGYSAQQQYVRPLSSHTVHNLPVSRHQYAPHARTLTTRRAKSAGFARSPAEFKKSVSLVQRHYDDHKYAWLKKVVAEGEDCPMCPVRCRPISASTNRPTSSTGLVATSPPTHYERYINSMRPRPRTAPATRKEYHQMKYNNVKRGRNPQYTNFVKKASLHPSSEEINCHQSKPLRRPTLTSSSTSNFQGVVGINIFSRKGIDDFDMPPNLDTGLRTTSPELPTERETTELEVNTSITVNTADNEEPAETSEADIHVENEVAAATAVTEVIDTTATEAASDNIDESFDGEPPKSLNDVWAETYVRVESPKELRLRTPTPPEMNRVSEKVVEVEEEDLTPREPTPSPTPPPAREPTPPPRELTPPSTREPTPPPPEPTPPPREPTPPPREPTPPPQKLTPPTREPKKEHVDKKSDTKKAKKEVKIREPSKSGSKAKSSKSKAKKSGPTKSCIKQPSEPTSPGTENTAMSKITKEETGEEKREETDESKKDMKKEEKEKEKPQKYSLLSAAPEDMLDMEMRMKRRDLKEDSDPFDNARIIADVQQRNVEPSSRRTRGQPWLQGRLAFSNQACRFELPMDMKTLETMSPIEYLNRYCIVCQRRKILYRQAFVRVDKDSDGIINRGELIKGLKEALVDTVKDEQINKLMNLIQARDDIKCTSKLFAALCALGERILYPDFLTDETKDLPEHRREKIEYADFSALDFKLDGTNVNPPVGKLLHMLL